MTAARPAYRILATDDVDPDGLALLRAVPSFTVDALPTPAPDELLARIGEYDALIVRSASKVTEAVLKAGTRLRVVARAGVGVDNIALDAATSLGVAVFNAPAGNTIAVAELLFGGLIGLMRHLPRADRSMHEGKWERAELMGSELRGRTMGIVGFGRIGSAVALRAKAFGMEVVAYDPYIPDERFAAQKVPRAATLDALLAQSHVCTLHIALTEESRGMIGARELAKLPKGAVLANLARGGLVDEAALVDALRSGHLMGAVLDSYEKEPLKGDHHFRDVPNVLLMPHLGASTREAQRGVSLDVCEAVRDALLLGELSRSINLVGGTDDMRALAPAITLSRRVATVARARLADQDRRVVEEVSIRVGEELAASAGVLLTSALAGVLEGAMAHERINLINARALAAARGIALAVAEGGEASHPRAIEVRVRASGAELRIGGIAVNGGAPRLTHIGPYKVDVALRSSLIVLTNQDVPGVIGRVGTALGDAKVNIAEYHQARREQGGEALAVIALDGTVAPAVRPVLLAIPDVHSATIVRFGDE